MCKSVVYEERNWFGSVAARLCDAIQRSQENVRSCAPFVPLYCEKLQVVGLSFLVEKQWDAAL